MSDDTQSPPPSVEPERAATGAKTPAVKTMDMGVYGRPAKPVRLSPAELIAFGLSLVWLLGIAWVYFGLQPEFSSNPVDVVMAYLAVILPIALIWVAASAAKTARTMREESARLQAAIDAMRHAYVEQQQMAGMQIRKGMEDTIQTLARAQERTEATIAGIAAERSAPKLDTQPRPATPQAAPDPQPGLALGTPAEELPEQEPLSIDEFIRAVNFPENENDKEGFRTLRRALQDRQVSKLINAAQDVLTLLSQDGIYTDDLVPDRAKPGVWRQFASGDRGREIAALGGIRDRSSLALAAGRMKSDPVFKDATLHFLRQFDKVVSAFVPEASDIEIAQFANTRTARAFMLLGRITGTFD